jgi:polyhydroxybutyrate depolymerase
MKPFFIFFSFLFATFTFGQSTLTGNITHDGKNRNYRVRIPANHDKNIALPLVFNLHGFTSNATQQEAYSAMNEVADTAKFVVCYPNGIGNAWNVGWNFGSTADDVGFISAMIDKFHTEYGIDKSRVYACGMSNGGFMSYRLACELNDRIAAIASVTGSMVQQAIDNCKPEKPVPIMEIHGTADGTVNYNGTTNISVAIPQILKFWQNNNGCDKDPIIEMVENINTSDNTTSEKWIYTNCTDDKKVVHYKVISGEHTWPGASISIGKTSQDFKASLEIWNFFKQYTLEKATSLAETKILEDINIYPNPVNYELNISSNHIIQQEFEIFDSYGRLWLKNKIKATHTSFNIENWPNGIYLIKIDDGNTILRFIKTN